MCAPSLKEVLAESNRCEGPSPSRSIDDRDYGAALIVAFTVVVMATGFSIALGLRPETAVIGTALPCLGYACMLFIRRSRQTAV